MTRHETPAGTNHTGTQNKNKPEAHGHSSSPELTNIKA